MNPVSEIVVALAGAAVMLAAAADAAEQAPVRQRDPLQQRTQERAGQREIIPGSELMTPAEREAYRQRYAAAKTDEARSKVRAEHIREMDARARMRGLRLAEPVPPGAAAK